MFALLSFQINISPTLTQAFRPPKLLFQDARSLKTVRSWDQLLFSLQSEEPEGFFFLFYGEAHTGENLTAHLTVRIP